MEYPRDCRWTGRRASHLLDDGADGLLADATDEHIAHQRIDLSHAALVAVEELGVKGAARSGHRQIVNHPDRGAERARAMPRALIAPLACPFISVGTDELRDLFFQDGDERGANGLSYLFLDKGAKGVLRRLTVRCRLGILGTGSHGGPPAWVSKQPQV